jgi:hypothetical protein
MNVQSMRVVCAISLAGLVLATSPALVAADEHAAHAAASLTSPSPASGMSAMPDMAQKMATMREQMAAIRATKDPAERMKLMEAHMATMETAMQNMQQHQGCMMMPHDKPAMPAASP